MSRGRELRLRTTLVVLLGLTMVVTLITLLVVGGGLLIWRLPEAREQNLSRVQHEAQQLADRMEIQLGGLQRQLELVGIILAQLPENLPSALLDALTADDQSFEAIYLADRDGKVEAASFRQRSHALSTELLGSDLSANRLYRAAVQRKTAIWSNKFLSALSGAVTVGVAIPLGGRVLIGELSLVELLKTLRESSRDSRLLVWVIDSRGELVAETGAAVPLGPMNLLGLPVVRAALEGKPLPGSVTLQGGEFYPAVAQSPLADWFFLVRMPAGLSNPSIRSNALLVLVALSSSLLVGLLLAPLAARWISGPMHAITGRARQVADGRPPGDWPRGPIAELNLLATDLEAMANRLVERRDQFQAIFNASPVAMGLVDALEDGVLVDVNEAWVRQFGRSRKETIGRSTWELQLWANEAAVPKDASSLTVKAGRFEVWLRDADERALLCELFARPVTIGGKTFAIWVVEDVTERKQAEKVIRSALAEKEVLLKEIYHRVKNNLQVVSSLLNLQGRRAMETETKRLLEDSANRVNSIALVHEQLYRAESLSSIALPEYVRQLADNLTNVNRPLSARVVLRVEVDDLSVGIESAIPVGLIVNELVSNSYRHGYPSHAARGEISVRIRGLSGGEIRLEVKDDGRGLDADIEPGMGRGLGMHLVAALTHQLGGELESGSCHPGTWFTIQFSPDVRKTQPDLV